MNEINVPHNVVPFARDVGFFRARAQEHARAGRMLEALELFRLMAERAQESVQHLEVAAHYSAMGAYELSNAWVYELLQRGEHVAACFFTLGGNYFAIQDHRRAQDCLLTALRLEPEGHFAEQAESMLDMLDESVHEQDMGERRADRALRRGMQALESGQPERAVRWLTYAMRKGGEDVETMALLGFAYLSCDRPKDGLACARRAYRRGKGNVFALCAMACALYALNYPVLCVKYLDLAEQAAQTPQEYALLCQTACETGAHDLVLMLLRAVHAEQPFSPSLLHMLAAACWNTGQVRQALQHWGTLRRLEPDNLVASARHEYAKAHVLLQGDVQEPPEPEEMCPYRMELSPEDCIEKLLSVQQTIRQGTEALQARFDQDTELAHILLWGLTVQDEQDATRFAMLSLLGSLRGERADRMLLALLTDTTQSEALKREAMSILVKRGLCGPYYMELGGRILRVMGQIATMQDRLSPMCERILQVAVDRLTPRYGDVVQEISGIWLPYIQQLEDPGQSLTNPRIWATALEAAYCILYQRTWSPRRLCTQHGISGRILIRYTRRLLRAMPGAAHDAAAQKGE